jgi:hypothetical protein
MERIKRKMTDETKEKIRKGNKGKVVSEATKEKLKEARAKRIMTAETKEKIRKGLIKYWKNVIWITDTDNKDLNK